MYKKIWLCFFYLFLYCKAKSNVSGEIWQNWKWDYLSYHILGNANEYHIWCCCSIECYNWRLLFVNCIFSILPLPSLMSTHMTSAKEWNQNRFVKNNFKNFNHVSGDGIERWIKTVIGNFRLDRYYLYNGFINIWVKLIASVFIT